MLFKPEIAGYSALKHMTYSLTPQDYFQEKVFNDQEKSSYLYRGNNIIKEAV